MGFLDKFFNSHSAKRIFTPMQSKTNRTGPAAGCPYCSVILDKAPTRKAKCPHCNNDIYVRGKQTLFHSSLLTGSQSDAVDAIKDFEYMGLSNKAFQDKQAQLTTKFGAQASVDDTLWGLYNDLIAKFAKSGEFMQLSVIYGSMAMFLAKRGRDGRRMQIEANKMTLRDYAKSGVVDCEVTCDIQPCVECEGLEGKKFTINQELIANPPLPPEGCTCKSRKGKYTTCNCTYVAKTMKSSFSDEIYQVN